jgi:hypothetical protein
MQLVDHEVRRPDLTINLAILDTVSHYHSHLQSPETQRRASQKRRVHVPISLRACFLSPPQKCKKGRETARTLHQRKRTVPNNMQTDNTTKHKDQQINRLRCPVLVGNGPRRGYWRVRVVPGGETGVFVGFSLHVCGNGLWESTSVCSPGFP